MVVFVSLLLILTKHQIELLELFEQASSVLIIPQIAITYYNSNPKGNGTKCVSRTFVK
jgi:hypothetical protein